MTNNSNGDRFVSYKWFTWALATVLAAMITVTAIGASSISTTKEKAANNAKQIEKIDKKLDKILDILMEHHP